MSHVEMHRADAGQLERLEHQADDLAVAFPAGVAVELRPDLHRAAPARDTFGQGVQDRPHVAQPRRTVAARAAGVDAGDLGSHVRADPHHAARELIDQLEGMELEILAGPGQQRLQVLDEGWGDDLVAPATEQVEERTPCELQAQRLGRHELVHAFREQPAFRMRFHRTDGCGDESRETRTPAQRTT